MAKAPAASSEPAAEPAFVSPRVTIVSTVANFRRGGIAHPTKAVVHEAGTFSKDAYDKITNEPKLVVMETPAEVAPVEPAPSPDNKPTS
jgi:hypothetical protein